MHFYINQHDGPKLGATLAAAVRAYISWSNVVVFFLMKTVAHTHLLNPGDLLRFETIDHINLEHYCIGAFGYSKRLAK